MKPLTKAFVLLLSLALLLPLAACGQKPAAEPPSGAGKTYYVDFSAPTGGDGSEAKPFASIPEARDAIRALKASSGLPDGGVEVILAAGTAHLTETVAFTAEDSGEAGKTITYRAAEGAEVVLDGGVTLSPDDFSPASEAVRARLTTEEARANVLALDLAAAGCFDLEDREYTAGWSTSDYRQELYVGGKRQTVARWPNEGYAETAGVTMEKQGETWVYCTDVPPEKAAVWAGEPSIRSYSYPYADWSAFFFPVLDADAEAGRITVSAWETISAVDERPYYIFNVLAELDSPGEYYWDVAASMLYYWPTEGWETRELSFSQLPGAAVSLEDASHLAFEGLTFRHLRAAAVASAYTTEDPGAGFLSVENCTIHACGAGAATLDGNGNVVRNCEIYDLGGYGLWLSGNVPMANLTPTRSVIENNLIHDWSQTYTVYNAAVTTYDYGYTIAHNEIHHSPHEALAINSGDTVVEYNEIHHVCTETNDAGAIYSGRRWDWGGNIYRYNYIHDVIDVVHGRSPSGIYLDDCVSEQIVYGNLFSNIGGVGICAGGGKYITIENNIFVNVALFTKRTGWDYVIQYNDRRGQGNNTWYPDGSMWAYLLSYDAFRSPLWRYSTPKNLLHLELATETALLPDYPSDISYGICNSNIAVGCPPETFITIEGRAANTGAFYDNVDYRDTDPGFADAANGDYNLREDSRVFSELLRFEPLPLDRIGRIK